MASLLIFGAGGHGRVVADAAVLDGKWTRVFASDRDPMRCQGELLAGVALLPVDVALAGRTPMHVAIGNALSREKEVVFFGLDLLVSVVHPDASVSAHAAMAPGCFVAAQAVLAPGAGLGLAVIVNHGAVVDHDVNIGDFSHIAPRAAVGGGARVGRHVLVGSGAAILPGLRIGDDVVIGAGAVVCHHLPEPGVYAGVPARRMK